jgi:hypothetical protein
MNRRWRWIAVVSALLVGISSAVLAADSTYKGYRIVNLVLNGKPLTSDVPAIIMDGRTLLPVRALSEALGTDVTWDGETYTASLNGRPSLDWAETAQKVRIHLKGIKQLNGSDTGDDTLAGRLIISVQVVNDGPTSQDVDLSNIHLVSAPGGATTKSTFVMPHVLDVTGDRAPVSGSTKVTLARGERVTANLAFDMKAADGVSSSDMQLVMGNPSSGGNDAALRIKIRITVDCSRRPCTITIVISF